MGGRNEQANLRQKNNRNISAVNSIRKIAATTAKQPDPQPNTAADNELDTNADTCCLGTNFIVLAYTSRVADVYAYDSSIEPTEAVPIVTGATAFDDPRTGMTYILVFNESLYYGRKLSHSLINPNQIRHYGIDVWDNPFDQQREIAIDINDDIKVPLQTRGTKLYFTSRVPTMEELETCQHINMTNPREWNPSMVTLSKVSRQAEEDQHFDLVLDRSLLYDVNPCLVELKELLTRITECR